MKVILYAITAEAILAASACAAFLRAGGHKARAVDATLLTANDRETVDFVVVEEAAADKVKSIYVDAKVGVVTSFEVEDFSPSRMASLQRHLDGNPDDDDGDEPDSGTMTVKELREALTAKGITFDPSARKAVLAQLLEAAG